jgi:low affinity Fe/Cu permease
MLKLKTRFSRFTRKATLFLGSPFALIANVLIVVVWAITGYINGFSDSHQLFINTFTTIYTYLMVTILQNSQNRDSRAIQLKLDELIAKQEKARNELIALEKAEDSQLDAIEQSLKDVKRCSEPN